MAADERPNVVLISPYRRAKQTAELVGSRRRLRRGLAGTDHRRAPAREGVRHPRPADPCRHRARHPQQAEFRRLLGKFYHRPPGGESWCDVILRLRSALDTMSLHYDGCRVLIVAHQVVVLCMRYLLEHMTEEQILQDRPRRRRGELRRDRIPVRSKPRPARRTGASPLQLRRSAGAGWRAGDGQSLTRPWPPDERADCGHGELLRRCRCPSRAMTATRTIAAAYS